MHNLCLGTKRKLSMVIILPIKKCTNFSVFLPRFFFVKINHFKTDNEIFIILVSIMTRETIPVYCLVLLIGHDVRKQRKFSDVRTYYSRVQRIDSMQQAEGNNIYCGQTVLPLKISMFISVRIIKQYIITENETEIKRDENGF